MPDIGVESQDAPVEALCRSFKIYEKSMMVSKQFIVIIITLFFILGGAAPLLSQWCGAQLRIEVFKPEFNGVEWSQQHSISAGIDGMSYYNTINDSTGYYSMSASIMEANMEAWFEFDRYGNPYLFVGCGGDYELTIHQSKESSMTIRLYNLCECRLSISIPFQPGLYEYRVPNTAYEQNTDALMRWLDISPTIKAFHSAHESQIQEFVDEEKPIRLEFSKRKKILNSPNLSKATIHL